MKKSLLFLLATLLLAGGLTAQEEVIVGDGTDNSTNFRAPTQANFKYHYAQNLYLPDEVGTTGIITSIGWMPSGSFGATRTWRVLLGETSMTEFSTTQWVPFSELTEVYAGPVEAAADGQWINLELTEPFTYSGDGNLVVAVEDQTGVVGTFVYWYSSIGTSAVRQVRWSSDYTAYTAENPPATATQADAWLPNIRLLISPNDGDICYGPVSVRATNVEPNSLTIVVTEREGYEGGDYILQYKLASASWDDGDAVTEVSMSGNTQDIEDLATATAYNFRVRTVCGTDSYSAWRSANVNTACGTISDFPWTEDFSSDWVSFGSLTAPDCWLNYDLNGDNDVWLRDAGGINGADAKIYTDYNSYNNDWLITPVFELDGNQMVTFMVRNHSTTTSEVDEIGVWISDEDWSTDNVPTTSTQDAMPGFTQVFQHTIPQGEATLYEVSLQGYSGERRIAFVRREAPADGWNLHLDDVTVDNLPACSRPTVSSIVPSSNSATISWSSTGSDFVVYYKPVGTTDYEEVTNYEEGATEGSYTITLEGLNASSDYTFYVVTTCEDESTQRSLDNTFTTLCALEEFPWACPQSDLYTIGNADWNSCWSYTSNVYRSTSNGILYVYCNAANTEFVLPPVDITDYSQTQFRFTAGCTTANTQFRVGIKEGSVTTWIDTLVATVTSGITDTVPYIVPLGAYTGNGKSLVVGGINSQSVYFTSFYVEPLASCTPVAGLTINSVSDVAATISWTSSGEETQWAVVVNGEEQEVATSTTLVLSNLSPNTMYSVSVSAMCGDDEVSISRLITFRTSCGAVTAADLPLIEDFESYNSGVQEIECWTRHTNYGSYPQTSTSSATTVDGESVGGKVYYMYTYSTSGNFLISPYIESLDGLMASCYMYQVSPNTALTIGLVSNPADTNTFLPLVMEPTVNNQWVLVEAFFGQVENLEDYHYVAFRGTCANTSSAGLYVDNLRVGVATTCPKVQNLTAANITESSATLGWEYPEANTTFRVSYVSNGETIETETTETSLVLENLQANTSYTITVVALCDGESTSDPRLITIHTACVMLTQADLPLEETFDSYISGSTGTIDPCWNKFTEYSTGYPYPYSSTHHGSSGNSLYFYAGSNQYNYVVLPPVDDLNGLMLSFWTYIPTPTSAQIQVGTMTDPNDASTFTAIYTTPTTDAASTWVEQEVLIPAGTTANYLAFRNQGGNYYTAYLDDVTLLIAPSCTRPQGISVSDITISSATVTIDDPSEANSYLLVWTDGSNTDSAVVGTMEYTINNLNSSTGYTVSVLTICEDGTRTATRTVTFRTLCDVIATLPWTDDFNSYNGTSPNYENDDLGCWETFTTSTAGGDFLPHVVNYDASNYCFSPDQTKSLFIKTLSSNTSIAILPPFGYDASDLKLEFWYKYESSSYGTLTVGYITDMSDIVNSFVVTETPTVNASTAGATATAYFADAPAGARMAIRWVQSYSTWYSVCIDNVTVSAAGDNPQPACNAPINLRTTSVTSTSATLDWNSTASAWAVSVNGGTEEEVYAHPYTIESLTPGTQYTVRVKALCDDDSESSWATVSFTTPLTDGIDDATAAAVRLYPNPATSSVSVEFEGVAAVSLLDLSGREVMSAEADSKATFDVSSLAKGAYFVRVTSAAGTAVSKLVVK